MMRKPRSIRHLLCRDMRYYARLAVPSKLREIVGKGELVEALGPDRLAAVASLPASIARFQEILVAARLGIPPAPPSVSATEAARNLYRAALDEDDIIRRSRIRTLEDKLQLEAWQNLRKSGSQIHLQNLKAIAHGPLSSKDWLDTDKPERRKALQQLFQQQTAQVDYEEADAAFLNAEIDANDSLIDATIGWAIDEACRDKSAPIRGSKEWLELVRALARAQADAIERVLERDLGDFGGSSQLLDATVSGKSVGSAVSLETLLEMYLTGLARAGRGLAMEKKRAD